MANRLIVTLVGIMLIAAHQASAMDTPSNMRLEDVRGPFRAMCKRCNLYDRDPRQPQRFGKELDCSCTTVYGNRVQSKLWLPACKNGTVLPDPRTGKLQCLAGVSFTTDFMRLCTLESDVVGSKMKAACWRKPAKKGFAVLREFDLIQCGGINGPPRHIVVDINRSGLWISC